MGRHGISGKIMCFPCFQHVGYIFGPFRKTSIWCSFSWSNPEKFTHLLTRDPWILELKSWRLFPDFEKNRGVSSSSWGSPNSWMVYKGESHLEMDDLGVSLFMDTSICCGLNSLVDIFLADYDMGRPHARKDVKHCRSFRLGCKSL